MSSSTVTFETAGLASAVTRAARVAPTKGAAYDKAAGVVIEIDPKGPHPITVKATDLEVTYLEWIEPIEIEGVSKKTMWRLPSQVFAGVLNGLPVTGQVTLSPEGSKMQVKAGRKKARVNMIDSGVAYMEWRPFDPEGLQHVEQFSRRVAEVAWATAGDAIPFTGIHMDGTHLIATDKYRLARVPCVVPIDVEAIAAAIENDGRAPGTYSPGITVPLSVVAPIFKNLTDAHLAATDNRLLIMPDDFTQITATIYDSVYPNLARVTSTDYPNVLTVEREALKDALMAMMVLCKSERYPRVDMVIGEGRIKISMDVEGVGDMTDEVPVEDGADHADFLAYFTPTFITDCLGATNALEVQIHYEVGNPLRMPYVTDGDAYEAWFTPRKAVEKENND